MRTLEKIFFSFESFKSNNSAFVDRIEIFLDNYKDYHHVDKYYQPKFLNYNFLNYDEHFYGKTLLTAACSYAPQYIDVLLKNGADVNKEDGNDCAPINTLISFKNEEYIPKLMKYGLVLSGFYLESLKKNNFDVYKIVKSIEENKQLKEKINPSVVKTTSKRKML